MLKYLLALASLTLPAVAQYKPFNQLQALEESEKRVAAGQDPMPGMRSCFWRYGPISGDPYINIAYPDAATFYWGAAFTIPEGAKLHLEGTFPHARYISHISYDGLGAPIDSVADYTLKPNAGDINPFLIGADRKSTKRGYVLNIVDAQPSTKPQWGSYIKGKQADTLYAPRYGQQNQQAIVYRIYGKDKNTDETGNGGLPNHVLTLANGQVLKGTAACNALRVRQPLTIDPAALAVPLDQLNKMVEAAKVRGGPNYPATVPPLWSKSSEDNSRYAIYTGERTAEDTNVRRRQGSFYANLDNEYVRTFINRRIGKVFVLRAKAPTTPKTLNGDAIMSEGELRYWSWCSQQGFGTARVTGCLFDEQFPKGPDGFYTLVVSRLEDKPRNALPQCGVAWLPMDSSGDGVNDPDMTLLILRHMLGTTGFKNAVQNIRTQETIQEDMGDYFPRGRYTTTSAFETAVPCIIEPK